ncbi:MAG: hypothetical protein ACRDZN_14900 [Acidimicrobiales bacterium]
MTRGIRGDVLALVDGAPGRLRTIEAAMARWSNGALVAAVHELMGRPAASERDQASAGPLVAAAAGEADGGESTSYVLVELPDRWRVVGRGHIAASDGRQSWVGTGSLVTERDSARAAIHDAGPIGSCLYPGSLLDWLDFGEPEPDEIEDRPCWVAAARPRVPGRTRTSVDATALRVAARLPDEFVGLEHRFWFDAATGIVLRHEGSIDGEPCSSTALTDVVTDRAIPPDEFAPPPEAIVRSSHELLRDHLAELGVDPETVDLDDPAQVRRALRQGFSTGAAGAVGGRRESRVALGDQPDDPVAAREAIRRAVERVGDTLPDGSLPNVQAGEGLAAVFERARLRAPGPPSQISTVLDDVRFLSAQRAVIWYSVLLDGRALSAVAGREGHAVLVDGRWLVERATFADVVGLAGVSCPPPAPGAVVSAPPSPASSASVVPPVA